VSGPFAGQKSRARFQAFYFTNHLNVMGLQKRFDKKKPVCKVTFSLPAEAVNGAQKVMLLGDFNNWRPEEAIVLKAKNGAYTATVELEQGREYQFKYLIDNGIWENDWAADKYVPGPFGAENSVVIVLN